MCDNRDTRTSVTGLQAPQTDIGRLDTSRQVLSQIQGGQQTSVREEETRLPDGFLTGPPNHARTPELEALTTRIFPKTDAPLRCDMSSQQDERQYRTLVEAARDMIWTLDSSLMCTYISPSVASILGFSPEEFKQLDPLALMTPESRERIFRLYGEELGRNDPGMESDSIWRTEEIQQYHKDGSVRWIEVTAALLRDDSGTPCGVMGSSRDITDRKKLEKIKTDFITLVAHTIRGPLTSIRGYSELLLIRDDISPEEQRECLKNINRQAVVLADIVSDLSDIAYLEAGLGVSLSLSWFRLDEMVPAIVRGFEQKSHSHGFEIDMPSGPLELLGDETRLGEVIKAVLSNAVKFSPEGSLVRISCAAQQGLYRISVEDHGIGMSSEEVRKVFDKFYRADTSDRAAPGHGLGMTVVKYLVEAMGGRVFVQSRAGTGTTVSLTIPARFRGLDHGGIHT